MDFCRPYKRLHWIVKGFRALNSLTVLNTLVLILVAVNNRFRRGKNFHIFIGLSLIFLSYLDNLSSHQ